MTTTKKIPGAAHFAYKRDGNVINLKGGGMTNHEMREVMVGMWASLDADDRADHIAELGHYAHAQELLGCNTWFSPVAWAVKEVLQTVSADDGNPQ